VSYSYIVLFTVWTCSPNWVKLSPQMVASFFLAVLLLLVSTEVLQSVQVIGWVVLSFIVTTLVVSVIMVRNKQYFEVRFGSKLFDTKASAEKHSDSQHQSIRGGARSAGAVSVRLQAQHNPPTTAYRSVTNVDESVGSMTVPG
jgi:amino acid transporter